MLIVTGEQRQETTTQIQVAAGLLHGHCCTVAGNIVGCWYASRNHDRLVGLGQPPKAVTIGYFVLAMFVAGYFTWLADHSRLMPAFGIKGFHVQETPIMSSMGFASEKQRAYLQIVPRLANAPVRECQGYLLRVSKDADGGWQETPMNEPLVLEWSLHEELSLTLHPGIEQRLNVCFWDEQRVITPAIVGQLPLRWFAVPNSVGKFRFDVRIISIDCEPVDVSIAMTLDNRTWNDPGVMLLEA